MTLLLDHPLVVTALEIATLAHGTGSGRLDGSVRVASRLTDPRDQVVALLHDVLGEATITGVTLFDDGVPVELVLDVMALTRRPDESYDAFTSRIHANGERPSRVKAAIVADRMTVTGSALLPGERTPMLSGRLGVAA